ncbi:MAG: PIG-L family deacetylase [Bacteroidetes bacterium]|nr:PIG-L family deacetylase [Bacteroidota bacterium]
MKKNLFVSVHPDDETLGCGGTILKYKEIGDENYWLIITAPTIDHPYSFTKEMIQQRENEIKKVSQLFGFHKTIQLGFPTQLLDEINIRDLVGEIDKAINEIKPQVLFLINRSDVHSDHRVAFQAVYACTKNFRKPFIEEILMYETLSETEFSPALNEAVFSPNVYVDITDFMDNKLEIMSVFSSEVMPDNLPRSMSAIRALAAYRGSRIGVNFAEAFMLIFQKR